MSFYRSLLIVGTAFLATRLHAQPVGVPDSNVVARFAPALFRAMDDFIATAAKNDSVHPFRLDLPSGPAWARIRRHAMRVVNGRPPTSNDKYVWTAGISSIVFERDTLSAMVHAGSEWRCADGTWQGSATEYRAFTVRHRDSWQGLTVTAAYLDSAGCSRTPNGELR
jgi:hypothetical protein